MEFSGNPAKYRRIAIVSSVVLNLYLYLGMAGLQYWARGSTWLLGWKPVLGAVLFTALFARLSYRWMLRLDARFGTGRGWTLESRRLKLPERALRRQPGKDAGRNMPPGSPGSPG